MTILLTKEQEALLERVLAKGIFETPEEFIEHSLTVALAEDEAFSLHLRGLLEESREDIAEGRVVEVPKGQLFDLLQNRRKKASGQ